MADTYQTIRCPACGNIMKKIFIPSAGVNIDICADGCGGIYFDCKELKIFQNDTNAGVDEINKCLGGKNFISVDKNELRVCPACASNMVKTKINGLNVQVDTCYNCGGIFLDYGELDIIRLGIKNPAVGFSQFKTNTRDLNMIRDFYKEVQFEEAKYIDYPEYKSDNRQSWIYWFLKLLFRLFR